MTTPANPDTSNSVGATDDASKGGLLNTGSDTILNGINNAIASNAEAAQTAATAAGTSASNAATSATNAAASASTASTKASEAAADAIDTAADVVSTAADRVQTGLDRTAASDSASAAAISETNSANSATAAAGSESAVSADAAAAAASETAAAASETAAATSETNAANSATSAANSVTAATTAKTAAETAKTGAETAETNAAASESAAAASETAAASSETNAANSATAAANSATAADNSATASANSATASETAKTASEAARDQALAAFDNFDDKYLGEKSSDPTVDNDGDPLQAGMLYFDTTNNVMKVYTGSAWVAAYVAGQGFASLSGADFTGAITAPSINLASTTLVNSILDEDNMASNSATALSTQQAIKSYVDTQVATVPVGDITAVTAGTGLSGGGTSGAVTLDIDSTVATLTGTQTLTNKTLGATSVAGNLTFTGTQTVDGRDVSVDGTKLDTIETNADVTDTANVTAAGAAMLTGATFTGNVTAPDFIGSLNGAIQFVAKNTSGGTITKGQAIYISGISGNTPEVDLADASNDSALPAFGLAGSTAADNSNLEIVTFGSIHGIQTNYTGWALGDPLYISTTAGILTNVPPTGEAAKIQNIGTVERLHSSNGTIKVGGAGRTNATPNLNDGNVFIGNASNQAAARALQIADTTGLQTALDGALPKSGGAMTGAITTNSTFDGRDVSADGAKLDGIEAGATADQTAAEIRALVESATDSNVFTDADHTKLNGIATNATAYSNSDVDTHLNTSTAATNEVLSWTGSDYDWVAQSSGGISNVVEDTSPQLGGDLQSNGNDIDFADNDKAIFGAGNDLQIFHNGSNSYIDEAGTGVLYIRSSQINLGKYTGENMIRAVADGAVTLLYNNTDKLATSSSGVTVTGTLAATAVTGDGSGLTNLPASGIANVVDDTTPQLGGDLQSNGNDIDFADNDKAVFGSAAELEIYSDGTHSYIQENDGSGRLYIRATNLNLQNSTGTNYLMGSSGSSVTLYYNGSSKLSTESGGVNVTGTLAATAVTGDGSGLTNLPSSGADLYAANEVSVTAQPSATGDDAVAIGDSASAAGANSFAIGHSASTASAASYSVAYGRNTSVTGNNGAALGYNCTAGTQAIALGNGAVASGNNSIAGPSGTASGTYSNAFGSGAEASNFGGAAFGRYATTAVNNYNVAIGISYASGEEALAAAIGERTASYGALGTNSVAIGYRARSNGTKSIAIGENTNVSAGSSSVVIGAGSETTTNYAYAFGYYCTSSGNNAFAAGGNTLAASADSVAMGSRSVANVRGKFAFASGRFAANGDAQGAMYILRADTTDATPTVLTTNNSAAGNDDQIIAANDTCIMFSGTLVAMQNGAQDQGGWEIKGLLKNDGGTTTLVSSNIQTFAGGNGWTVALTADNTNNALAITCTGEAAHNIRWVANISTSEVTYA